MYCVTHRLINYLLLHLTVNYENLRWLTFLFTYSVNFGFILVKIVCLVRETNTLYIVGSLGKNDWFY